MTHEVPRMSLTSYKDEPDKGVTKVHMAVRDPPPQTRRWSESSWDGLGVQTDGHRTSALVRLHDIFPNMFNQRKFWKIWGDGGVGASRQFREHVLTESTARFGVTVGWG